MDVNLQSVASFRTAAEVESELCCRGTMALPALDANFAHARIHRGDKSFAAEDSSGAKPALVPIRFAPAASRANFHIGGLTPFFSAVTRPAVRVPSDFFCATVTHRRARLE